MTIKTLGLMGEMDREIKVDVTGIDGYNETGMHFDINGKWGGKRAVVAHFQKDGADKDAKYNSDTNLICLYVLVGDYWRVGKRPDDAPDAPSRWEIAKLVTEAMENGADRKLLYQAIKSCLG